ncbi:MAG TPA: zf-HC2 domain-containing protein [Blastocatellia bacterium]|nr:zf-HC2 domain-containing protein [Blastocatellia bacterium]
MDCRRFEEHISEYLDGAISKADRTLFQEHALQCRPCRSLLDEVKGALHDCKMDDELDLSPTFESALITIAGERAAFSCPAFEELITEFLDGFVPASVYHRFEEHASGCNNCSGLLTDVVYAVAACHSVHTYEEVEAPESLVSALDRIASPRRVKKTLANRVTAFASGLIARATPKPRWTFATASSLVFATFAFLLFGFSDDGTFRGIYRQAQLKFGQIYSQGADIYSRKDELAARIELVGHGIEEIWDSLGGAAEGRGKADSDQSKRNRDAGKKPVAGEKN